MADKKRVLTEEEKNRMNDLYWNHGRTFTQVSKEMHRSVAILYRTIFTTREEYNNWGKKFMNGGLQ